MPIPRFHRNYTLNVLLLLTIVFVKRSSIGAGATPDSLNTCENEFGSVEDCGSTKEYSPDSDEDVRILTKEELSSKKGDNNGPIWLSILGEVYDVTAGREFYGEKSGYGAFAGIDASPAFSTGKFDEEGCDAEVLSLSDDDIMGVDHWRKFYEEQDVKYPFLGVLSGTYYSEDGYPTETLLEVFDRIEEYEKHGKKRKRDKD